MNEQYFLEPAAALELRPEGFMSDELTEQNSYRKVRFRESVLKLQEQAVAAIANGYAVSVMDQCTLKHYFSPIHEQYGCCAYAREIVLPKRSIVIGKIHKHQHLNFLMKGKVTVSTEFGVERLEAPMIFVSKAGIKRVVFAVEDSIWAT